MRNPTFALLITLATLPAPLVGQGDMAGVGGLAAGDSAAIPTTGAPMQADEFRRARVVRPWHALVAAGVLAGVSLLDQDARTGFQDARSSATNDVAGVARHFGQPEVYGVVALGTIGVGLVTGKPEIRRAGERITGSLLVAGLVSSGLKVALGRERPSANNYAHDFDPPATDAAFPSGHTSVAFALAASVSDELHSLPASIALYSAATLTGWSRLNDNKHWLSDVLGGALVGIASAKLMNGRWQVFGVRAPRFVLGPGQVGASFQF